MTKIFSLTKLYSGCAELSYWYLTFRLTCSLLPSPILSRILLSQFSQNSPSSRSDQPPYLIKFLIFQHPPGNEWVITLACGAAEILFCQVSQILYYPGYVLVIIFYSLTTILLLGCKFSFFLVVFEVEPGLSLPTIKPYSSDLFTYHCGPPE